MGKKQKSQMPMSTAGLVRYFDDYEEAFTIKPGHVLLISASLIIVEILLKKGIF